ncbi:hypothetical protein EF096_11850 [Pseudomonas neustonica]|jgi:hypothetical protein|uniref:Secreted protein n=1 Tax=Pseudomonas neustonica TaxID=2487346 RepID=A0ABX9XKZ3_9PSED|nr:hypothetical protein [Pseudomonadales bacterium]ROZ81983.1 hypothetical protein EF099_13320 [Pseudomonas sp. SSM44]ROZ83743.1 hypothetical protein EF096_11850 [Pseudomonas neustonica]|tara:strand:+ start:3476 stop:3730 length:255 start_codon:yes stop_codon:yes gene_type:complete
MRSVSGVFLAWVTSTRVQSSHRIAAGWQRQRQFNLLLLHRETALGQACDNKGLATAAGFFMLPDGDRGLSTQVMRISAMAGFAY